MYLEHFGLTDSPFTITPHTEVFFEGAQRGAILDALVYAVVQGEGLIKVTGEVGSGKTMLCRMLAERLPRTVETIYLAIPSLTRDEILRAIAEDLGLEVEHKDATAQRSLDTSHLLRALQTKLIELHEAGRRVVVLIDEAHAMPLESLEEIRLLSNLETQRSKLLQIVMFGQPELDAHLSLKHMRQLKERITQSFTLAPLAQREVDQYLKFRLRSAGYRGPELFNNRCTAMVTHASQGLSRRINILADKTLLAAFADNTHNVRPSHIKAALRDSEFHQSPRGRRRVMWVSLGFALAGVVLGAALGGLYWGRIKQDAIAASTVAAQQTQPTSPTPVAPVSPPVPAGATATSEPTKAATQSVSNDVALETLPMETLAGSAATQLAMLDTESAEHAAFAAGQAGAKQASPSPTETAPPEAAVPPAARGGEPAWQHSREWMHAQPAQTWVIQLMLSDMAEDGERSSFVARASAVLGVDKLREYQLQLNGIKKIGVLYGPFSDRRAAQRALVSLPSSLRQYQPYMRTVGVVRQEAVYN